MKDQLIKFWKDEEGATAIEYALIAGLIAVAIIAALNALSDEIQDTFNFIGDELNGVRATAGESDGG